MTEKIIMTPFFVQLVEIFEVVAGGLITSILFSFFAIKIANWAGLIDIPGSASHKKNSRPFPQAGGIAIILCALVLMTVFRL